MSVSVVITSFAGFPSPCALGNRSLSQGTKQLEFKADHFHIVLILRINGTPFTFVFHQRQLSTS